MKAVEIRALLERHGLHLHKDLGQNFLVDETLVARLVEQSGVQPGDRVIEVGTGLGVFTRALAERAQQVVTVEIDSGVVRALREESLLPANVELLHADALALDLRSLIARVGGPTRLVANLPYVAATPLLRRLLDLRDVLTDWSVMLQREVGARLVASPGTRDYGSLSVLHQLTAEVSLQAELSPGNFFPAPRVQSHFLRITPRPGERDALGNRVPLGNRELAWLERVIRPVFGQRRKTIANGLRTAGFDARDPEGLTARALRAAGIDPGDRAERVAPEALLALARGLRPAGEKAAEVSPETSSDDTSPAAKS